MRRDKEEAPIISAITPDILAERSELRAVDTPSHLRDPSGNDYIVAGKMFCAIQVTRGGDK